MIFHYVLITLKSFLKITNRLLQVVIDYHIINMPNSKRWNIKNLAIKCFFVQIESFVKIVWIRVWFLVAAWSSSSLKFQWIKEKKVFLIYTYYLLVHLKNVPQFSRFSFMAGWFSVEKDFLSIWHLAISRRLSRKLFPSTC